MSNHGSILIVGGSGTFGLAILREFQARSNVPPIRVLTRSSETLKRRWMRWTGQEIEGVEIVEGDARDAQTLFDAAQDCQVLIQAVGASFPNAYSLLPEVSARIIAAACLRQATVLVPSSPLVKSANLTTRQALFWTEIEDLFRHASQQGHARAIVLRSGRWFGPLTLGDRVDSLFLNASQNRPLRLVGRPEAIEPWSYLLDVVRLAVDVLELDHLQDFEEIHHPGYVHETRWQFARNVAQAAGYPELEINLSSWNIIRLLSWFRPDLQDSINHQLDIDHPPILDNTRSHQLLPHFQNTTKTNALQTVFHANGEFRANEVGNE